MILTPDWAAPSRVRSCVSTSDLPGASRPPFERGNLGDRCGDDPDDVAANRRLLIEHAGLPGAPRWLRQVHGIDVHVPQVATTDAQAPIADAAYTCEPGVVCAVLTADCLPLLVASEDGREVAAIHAGWRGLAAGVIEATLRHFRAPATQLRVWLGPAIGAASYEVGDEVRAAFLAHDAAAAQAFTATRPGHWLCDLYALARQRLAALGVGKIDGGGFDTFTDARFYSHRRGRPTGRFASMIWIDANADADAVIDHADASPRANTKVTGAAAPLLFPRLLGNAFAHLPRRVRVLHLAPGTQRYRGAATITRGGHWLARLCGWATGLPPAMTEGPLEVELIAQPQGEQWTRHFGAHVMRSRMWEHAGLLSERLGLVTFGFTLSVTDGVLTWRVQRVRTLGLPLPAAWFRGVYARESEADGRYRFEVAAALPLAGELVHYAGWLDVE